MKVMFDVLSCCLRIFGSEKNSKFYEDGVSDELVWLIRAAELAYRNKDYENAARNYDDALELADNDKLRSILYNDRGHMLLHSKEIQKAATDFQAAVNANGSNASALNNLGDTLCKMGEIEKGIDYLTKAISLDNEFALAYNNRGVAFQQVGKYNSAIADLSKAIDLSPRSSKFRSNRAFTYLFTANYKWSKVDAEKAVQMDPYNGKAYCHLAAACLSLGQISDALYYCQTASRLEPNYARCFYVSGCIRQACKLNQLALEDFEHFLSLVKGTPLFKTEQEDTLSRIRNCKVQSVPAAKVEWEETGHADLKPRSELELVEIKQ